MAINTLKSYFSTLAGEAQRIEGRPVNQKVSGLIPSQGIYAWVASHVPSWGHARGS